MFDPLRSSVQIAGSGIQAQSERLRVISENIANANSMASTPGGDPYGRKTISFEQALDQVSGAANVKISSIGTDQSPFRIEKDPGNPAADAAGNVKLPNVDLLIELADLRDANRSYSANVQVVKQSRELISQTIDLLRNNG